MAVTLAGIVTIAIWLVTLEAAHGAWEQTATLAERHAKGEIDHDGGDDARDDRRLMPRTGE